MRESSGQSFDISADEIAAKISPVCGCGNTDTESDDAIHDECGVFGVYSQKDDVVSDCYYGLYALQHRGQESCGIAVNDGGIITCHKALGLVNDVFNKHSLDALGSGSMAVGHCRYSTTGSQSSRNAQPLVVNHVKGSMAIAHNGNLTNADKLRSELENNGSIFHTTSDTEVIAYIITRERLHSGSIEEALSKTMNTITGAYSLVVMSPSKLIACRDPHGFKPLCLGKLDDGYVFASESCALDAVGARFVRDVEPGEIVVVSASGLRSIRTSCNVCPRSLCVFEFIYFARPDSVIDGSSVHMARQRAGEFLAREHPVDADVVIGVPDSGLDAALGYSKESGIPFDLGFIKNKYIGRTFIQPEQADREDKVRIKLNAIPDVVKGKRVVMVDDSIVRGTTCARIIGLLRACGATEVHMRVSSPPFLFPCYFGTDIDSKDNLIANDHSVDEIRDIIGADSLGYLSTDNVIKLAPHTKPGFCTACFTGDYPVPPPDNTNKSKFMYRIGEYKEE